MATRKSRSNMTNRGDIIYSPDYVTRSPGRDIKGYDKKYVPLVLNYPEPEARFSKDDMIEFTKYLADKGNVYDRLHRPVNSDYIDKHSRFYEVSVPMSTYKRTLKQAYNKTKERGDKLRPKHPDWGTYYFEELEVAMADLARKTRARRRRSGRTSLRR
jgi:hypothetical protein